MRINAMKGKQYVCDTNREMYVRRFRTKALFAKFSKVVFARTVLRN